MEGEYVFCKAFFRTKLSSFGQPEATFNDLKVAIDVLIQVHDSKFILAAKLKVMTGYYDIFMLVSTPEEYLMASRW